MKIDSKILFSMNLDNILQMLEWIRFLSDEECDLLIEYLELKKKDLEIAKNTSNDIGVNTDKEVKNNVSNIKDIELDEDPENITGVKIVY